MNSLVTLKAQLELAAVPLGKASLAKMVLLVNDVAPHLCGVTQQTPKPAAQLPSSTPPTAAHWSVRRHRPDWTLDVPKHGAGGKSGDSVGKVNEGSDGRFRPDSRLFSWP